MTNYVLPKFIAAVMAAFVAFAPLGATASPRADASFAVTEAATAVQRCFRQNKKLLAVLPPPGQTIQHHLVLS